MSESTPSTRDEIERLKRLATYASVSVASGLFLTKLAAWLVTGSVTVFATAMDSLVDVAASMVVLLSVRFAMRPPDLDHRFGHGKLEPLGSLGQAVFIGGTGLFVIFQAVDRLLRPTPIVEPGIGIGAIVLALVATAALVMFQRRVIRRTGSLAIEADSLNYQGDLISHGAALLSLLIAPRSGLGWVDPVTGLAIAAYLLWNAQRIGRASLQVLMDRELPDEQRQRIHEALDTVEGMAGYHDLRTRSSGTHAYVEVHIEVDGVMTVSGAHSVVVAVEEAIEVLLPGSDVLVHVDPVGVVEERLDDAIARRGPRQG